MNKDKKVVIVGGGHAGGNLVASLRQAGFDGHITLVSDETCLPYHRPPLSKSWLKESVTIDRVAIKPASFYDEKKVKVLLESRVENIDREQKKIFFDSSAELEYDYLVIATGARARKIAGPGSEFEGISYLRNLFDAERLKCQLNGAKHLVVIGGGYIGLEVAASARQLGLQVSVIERESRLLARVASEQLSHYYQNHHQSQGVNILLEKNIVEFKGRQGHLQSVVLESGEEIRCDIALVGIGAIPNDDIARQAGLRVNNGIVVDHEARTSDASIFAIGDVSHRPLPVYGCNVRLENISNTLEQAKIVSSVITGQTLPPEELPWFWSDQYEIKLQIAGLAFDAEKDIVRGNPATNKFSVFRFKGEKLMAVEAVNMPVDFMVGKKWISTGVDLNIESISNPSINIKECVM